MDASFVGRVVVTFISVWGFRGSERHWAPRALDAAATTWIVRGDESRHRRGPQRGYSVEGGLEGIRASDDNDRLSKDLLGLNTQPLTSPTFHLVPPTPQLVQNRQKVLVVTIFGTVPVDVHRLHVVHHAQQVPQGLVVRCRPTNGFRAGVLDVVPARTREVTWVSTGTDRVAAAARTWILRKDGSQDAAAAGTWIFRGDGSQDAAAAGTWIILDGWHDAAAGRDVDIPRRRIAAPPRVPHG